MFASTNALKNNDILPIDDVENNFYILIYLLNGSLPLEMGKNVKVNSKSEIIINIRHSLPTSVLCQKFPFEFQQIFDEIKNGNKKIKPDFHKIIKTFESFKNYCHITKNQEKLKFKWNELFVEALKIDSKKWNDSKKKEINELFYQYGLKLKNYIDYLID